MKESLKIPAKIEPKKNNIMSMKDDLLLNLGAKDEDKQYFYNLFLKLWDQKKHYLIEDLQSFIEWKNNFDIFINNICVILSGEYGSFWKISSEIMDFLRNLAKNDESKLKEIYADLKKVSDLESDNEL